jgi:acetyl esterase
VEDCYAALNWCVDNAAELGVDTDRIAITGGSSGGMLTIVTCLLARDRQEPKIALQIPIVPALTSQKEPPYPSRSEFKEEADPLPWFIDMYLRTPDDAKDVRASPILVENFSDLPPALVITAGHDPLRDEGRHYVEQLRAAGVPVDHVCFEGANHQAMAMPGVIRAARQAVDRITEILKERL